MTRITTRMEGHCDMRGFLSFLCLRLIGSQDMSGQCIRSEIEKRKGCMPSAGTIYPVLKDLHKKGFIKEVEGSGKTKMYMITEKGKKELQIATKKFVSLFCDMKSDFNCG